MQRNLTATADRSLCSILSTKLKDSESSDEDSLHMSKPLTQSAKHSIALSDCPSLRHRWHAATRSHKPPTGAADAQLSVDAMRSRTHDSVEWMKDGDSEGDTIASRLEQVEVGVDEDGEPITSCIVMLRRAGTG